MQILLIFLLVLLVFNLLIVVHEAGHFLAAKWRGLVIEKFGVWFGPPLWKKTINGVEFSLGTIPAGGFVALPQMAPMDVIEGKSHSGALPAISPLDKIIVAAAGPTASLLLGLAFALVVAMVGRPVSEPERTTTIGYVMPDSPASEAGLIVGDRILQVNGNEVHKFSGMGGMTSSIAWNIVRSEEENVPVVINRDGKIMELFVKPKAPEHTGWGRRPLKQIGILARTTPVVDSVMEDSPAARAGLEKGDIITSVNGVQILNPIQMGELLKNGEVEVEVMRAGKELSFSLTPRTPEGGTEPGLGIDFDARGVTTLEYPNPIALVVASASTIWDTIAAIVSPSSDIKPQHLSGPVGIMRIYYLLFESADGWRLVLWFSVILNVNLAVMNLLPLPVLDGGHILLGAIEGVRRRPLSKKFVEATQVACGLLLMGFILYVSYFDMFDLPNPLKKEPEISYSEK